MIDGAMINRRQFLSVAPAAAAAGAQARRAPNVLFLISDDLDCRIGCYGDPVAKTPHLDGLAARGVRFDRAYCQFPLCNPTRSSVLSGRYPTSTGVLDNNTYLVLEPGQERLPDYFAAHGYAVAEFGKIHHGPNRGLRRGEAKPERAGWFTPEERARQEREQPAYWEDTHSPYRNARVPVPRQYAWANVFGPLAEGESEADEKIAGQAVAKLREAGAAGKPFFLAVGLHKPHVPLKAPKRYFDLYDPEAMPLPPDFDTEPRALAGYPGDEFRQNIDLFAGRSFTAQEAREAMRAYYACVSYLDAQVGRVLEELRAQGLEENTIVVLWGDHGWHLSEKGMWAKGTLFEVSARGPLLIVDPRRRASAGRVSRRVVEYVDLYPTLTELCGLPAPGHLEGASLAPLLAEPDGPWERPAYTVQVRGWRVGRSVRTERWRYTEWDEGRRGAALFDHERDPHEMRNLAADPAQRETVARLAKLLREGPVRARR